MNRLAACWRAIKIIFGIKDSAVKVGVSMSQPIPPRKAVDWIKFVELGKQLVGKSYRLGAEVNLWDSDPSHIKEIDCSELVEWLYAQVGVMVPDGSYNQIKETFPVEKANVMIGDLGFKWNPDTEVIHHVGVYLGANLVLEAKGIKWGTVLTDKAEYESSSHFARWGRVKNVEAA